jgi:hypothetical protein
MSSINARNSSQALAHYSSQLATTKNKASSKSSKFSLHRGGLGVKVAKDGGLSGKVRPGADGKVSLPGGLTLQAPPAGGLATHMLAPNKLLVLTTDARGLVSLSTKNLGVALDAKNATLKGSALPKDANGQKVVDLPGLGQVPVPDQGRTSSFLLAEDKLLSLKHEADGTITVDTKTLGLEADKKGNFKGHVLPDANGKVDIGGKELDVSGLKPGQSMKKTLKVKGKKYKVELRMNEDGSVSVEGKRKKGFLSKVGGFIGKALSFAGRFAPFLAAIPGLGWAAMAGRIFSAVKGVVDGIKSGNWLGAIGSAAGGIAGFAKGALGAIAGKVSQVAHFGQSVLNTVKHGLGKGLLPIIANGANLLSGLGGLFGNKGLAETAGKVSTYASVAESARKGDFGPALQQLVNQFGTDIVKKIQEKKKEGVEFFFHEGVKIKPSEFALPDFDWSTAELSTLPPGTTSSQADRARHSLDPNAYASVGEGLVAGNLLLSATPPGPKNPKPHQLSKDFFGMSGRPPNETGVINNSAELAQFVYDGYNGGKFGPVSITPARLQRPGQRPNEGRKVYLMGISGTEVLPNQSTGWITNLKAGFNQGNPGVRNAKEAIYQLVPKGSDLVLAGHSQGGMIAQQLAADPDIKRDYNVVQTVTFGSPLIEWGNREGDVNRIAAKYDPVPRLSFNSGLDPVGAVWSIAGQQNIPSHDEFGLNGIAGHMGNYTDEGNGPLINMDALGRSTPKDGKLILRFDPKDRRFFTSPTNTTAPARRTA